MVQQHGLPAKASEATPFFRTAMPGNDDLNISGAARLWLLDYCYPSYPISPAAIS
jgi:hypothetical protein